MRGAPARLLIIAGSDSGGGAGLQADIKTACAFGVYAMTAVTAVTAQDTVGVHAIQHIPASLVREQISHCLSDIGADAIKTGMLASADVIEAVADVLERQARGVPLVLDPVLASSSGTPLLELEGIEALKKRLVPLATIVTPNLVEMELLGPRKHPDDLLDLGAAAVLLKGGHGSGDRMTDFFFTRQNLVPFERPRIKTSSTHGTGCTLAAGIACGLANGRSLPQAIEDARNYLQSAISTAPGFGRGSGPLNHLCPPHAAIQQGKPRP